MEIHRALLDWAEVYFKSRDAMARKIQELVRRENDILIKYKDNREEVIYAFPDLSGATPKKNSSIITLNNPHNMDVICNQWDQYAAVKELRIYFINPFSTLEKKWVLAPSIHAKICDPSSLRTGLKALSENIEPVTESV